MIKAIFAVDHWGGMGNKGTLPWPHHKEDLQYFKEMTNGGVVIMGRRTYDDPKMPKPLPGRITYVATHRYIRGVNTLSGDLTTQIKKVQGYYPEKTLWIIGGPQLLVDTKDLVEEAHISHFKGQYNCDTKIDIKKYLSLFRAQSAATSSDKLCSWMTYKNIDPFRPL